MSLVETNSNNQASDTAKLTTQKFNLIQRRFPPMSLKDTGSFGNGLKRSIHGKALIFDNQEITHIHQPDSKKKFTLETSFKTLEFKIFFNHGKAIFQQQGIRACTAAVVAMLILDMGGVPDWQKVRFTNLGSIESMSTSLTEAKLDPVRTLISNETTDLLLKTLQQMITQNGPVVAQISGPSFGAHVIILDQVANDLKNITIRDPYHGWMVDVKSNAFLSYWQDRDVLQAKIPNRKAAL